MGADGEGKVLYKARSGIHSDSSKGKWLIELSNGMIIAIEEERIVPHGNENST